MPRVQGTKSGKVIDRGAQCHKLGLTQSQEETLLTSLTQILKVSPCLNTPLALSLFISTQGKREYGSPARRFLATYKARKRGLADEIERQIGLFCKKTYVKEYCFPQNREIHSLFIEAMNEAQKHAPTSSSSQLSGLTPQVPTEEALRLRLVRQVNKSSPEDCADKEVGRYVIIRKLIEQVPDIVCRNTFAADMKDIFFYGKVPKGYKNKIDIEKLRYEGRTFLDCYMNSSAKETTIKVYFSRLLRERRKAEYPTSADAFNRLKDAFQTAKQSQDRIQEAEFNALVDIDLKDISADTLSLMWELESPDPKKAKINAPSPNDDAGDLFELSMTPDVLASIKDIDASVFDSSNEKAEQRQTSRES